MAATTRKSTAAKTTPTAKTAPATPPAAPAAVPNGRLDLTTLAANATQAPALPKKAARTGGGTGGAFDALVKRSYDEKIVLSLPAVADDKAVTTLRNALRRSAARLGIGVTIRPEKTDAGFVVYFQGKAKGA